MYRVMEGKLVDSWISIDPSTIRAQQAAQRAMVPREGMGNRPRLI